MNASSKRTHPWRRWILGSMSASLLLTLGANANEPRTLPAVTAPAGAPTASCPALGLADCVNIALEKQPALAAQRASVAAAYTQQRALQELRTPVLLARDLPIRRKQACLGISIAEAGLSQTQWEVVYSVKRTYLAALYARSQQAVADDLVDSLKFYRERVKEAVDKGTSREWSQATVDKITVYLGQAESKQAEAARGFERAMAALREAMGVGPEFCQTILAQDQPAIEVELAHDYVVNLALSRRGELVQASQALEVVNLEVDAQGKTCLPTARTFAAGTDIHARPIPQGTMNGEYRPAAVGIEMPTLMAGSKANRMQRAQDLSGRAAAVVDKTHNLIALEAEDVLLRWQEAKRKVSQTREAAEAARRLVKSTRERIQSGLNVKIEDDLTNEVISAQARAGYNEARYQQGLALAALERVTAGGIPANFTTVGTVPATGGDAPRNQP